MIESFVGVVLLLVAVAFRAFILDGRWHMLLALRCIDRSVLSLPLSTLLTTTIRD